jgi:hypothetical protein
MWILHLVLCILWMQAVPLTFQRYTLPPFSGSGVSVHVYAGFSHRHGGRARSGVWSRTKRAVSYEGHGVHWHLVLPCSHPKSPFCPRGSVGPYIHDYSLNLLISTLNMEAVHAYQTSKSMPTSKRNKDPSTMNHHERPESVNILKELILTSLRGNRKDQCQVTSTCEYEQRLYQVRGIPNFLGFALFQIRINCKV